MTEALTPGRPVGEVDDAHRRVLDAAGLEKHRLAACGYSQGTTFQPNWMDWADAVLGELHSGRTR